MSIRFTNCVLALDGTEVKKDLYISPTTGKVLQDETSPNDVQKVIDLGGRLLCPGMIDIQLNGALGFDFSTVPDTDEGMPAYANTYADVCKGWIKTGVTSFLPTVVTNPSNAFQKALPHLGPNGHLRDPHLGVESLGAHCEGPFIHPEKKGAHSEEYIQLPGNGIRSIEALYGAENLKRRSTTLSPVIKKITIAPELPGSIEAIKSLTKEHGIVCSIGHTTATYEQGLEAVKAGATMITHLFNAMDPFLHRAPGLVGLISAPVADLMARPYFGLISDDIHLSPNSVRAAWLIHEEGCILTTDATAVTGLPDGTYDSRLGVHVVKKGKRLVIEGTDTVAGGAATLLQCVNNLIQWTGINAARALKSVTLTPAQLLGCADTKGSLHSGADADLVVFSWDVIDGKKELKVDQVWKFGVKVFDSEDTS